MVESIMLFGVGYLVASRLGLALISVVHQRAVRLTERRLADERCRLEGMIARTRTEGRTAPLRVWGYRQRRTIS
jgi:hypothetical protein